LGFVGGDPDRPIIASAVTNPATTSPVTSSNQTTSVIRDNGNNEIILDSADGGQIIHIKQACGHEFKMDTGGEKIELRDKYGNEIVLDSAAGTITLYSPTHESKVVIGKSIDVFSLSDLKWESATDWISNIAGKAKYKVGGDVFNFFLGFEHKNVIGWKARTVGGFKQEAILGAESKFIRGAKKEVVKGSVFKSHVGKEYKKPDGDQNFKAPSVFRLIKNDKENMKEVKRIIEAKETRIVEGEAIEKIKKRNAEIDHDWIEGKESRFRFKTMEEQCNEATIKYKSKKVEKANKILEDAKKFEVKGQKILLG
ncbi:MAG: hypothetical protein WBB64_02905, partial [Anaerolineales bacterium]